MAGEDVDDAGGEAGFFDEGGDFQGLQVMISSLLSDFLGEFIRTVSGAFSLLLRTIVFPAIIAGAIFEAKKMSGPFQGMMAAATPKGCRNVMFTIPGVFKLFVGFRLSSSWSGYIYTSPFLEPPILTQHSGRSDPLHSGHRRMHRAVDPLI